MNAFKRFLSMLLVLCMLISVVPLTTHADEADGTESTEAPTQEPTEAAEGSTEATVGSTEAAEETTAVTQDDNVVSTFGLSLGTKPADSTVTGEPFDTTVSKNYRIPGLVNHNGTLIATADARWDYEKDGGGMDLVVSRSTDGNTWNYTFAGYLGDNGNVWNENSTTLMDPVIISDGSTLYMLADMFPAGYSISDSSTANVFSDTAIGFDSDGNILLSDDDRSTYGYYLKDGKVLTTAGTETGYTVRDWYDLYQNDEYVTNLFFSDSPFQVRATSYICLTTSTDGGKSWSAPTLLNVKPSGVAWMVLGPGSGLALDGGNIAFTAYDNSNIYLIWGSTANGWHSVSTSAATNESSIIELNDGTIRAFVKRKGNNTIAYVDFTKSDSGYSAGELVPTSDANFSNCMVSSLHYSKTLNGKEVVLVCCPSDSNGGEWSGRFNGKIYMYTLDSNNAMTLVGTHQLNNSFFAYSNMAEKNDGTIGLLYEDGCINYQGSSYGGASHITYTSVDLEDAFNVTFDIPKVVDVALKLGETMTFSDSSGAYDTAVTEPDANIVEMTLRSENGDTNDQGVVNTPVTTLEDGTYVIVNTRAGKLVNNESSSQGAAAGSMNGLALRGTTSSFDATTAVWTIKAVDGGYTVQDVNGDYMTIASNSGAVEDAENVLSIVYKNDCWTLSQNGAYLNDAGNAGTTASGWKDDEAAADAGSQFTIYAYSPSSESTEVTFTGKAPGKTVAKVGNTQYNITVTAEEKTENVELWVGETVTYTDLTGNYAETDYSEPNGNYATMDVTGTSIITEKTPVKITDADYSFDKTKFYIIENVRAKTSQPTDSVLTSDELTYNTTGLDMNGPLDVATSQHWTITPSNDGYFISRNGEYVTMANATASMESTSKALSFEYVDGRGWLIYDNLDGNTTSDNGDCFLSDLYGNTSGEAYGYTTKNDDGNYWNIYEVVEETSNDATNVTFTGVASGATTAKVGYTTYNITVQYRAADVHVYTDSSKTVPVNGTVTADDIAAFNSANSSVVTAALSDDGTALTFTGVGEGTVTNAILGNTKYTISVTDAPTAGDIADFNNIVGEDTYSDDNANETYRSDLNMAGKAITKLTLSAGAEFNLNVDVTGYDSVEWSVADTSIATVDENGVVTAIATGETTVTATVTKDGKIESISIPVVVKPSQIKDDSADTITSIFFYIDQVDHTTPYYTVFLSTGDDTVLEKHYTFVPVTEGEVIWIERPENSALGWLWTATPDADHALVYMASTGSASQYYPLKDTDGNLGESDYDSTTAQNPGAYYKNSISYKNIESVGNDVDETNWRTVLDKYLATSISQTYNSDGAMSNTRWGSGGDHGVDGVPKMVSSMTFISDPIPSISKTVDGVLPTTRLRADYRKYTEGMVAGVDELVYFKITVTLERPTVWADEANGIGAITYTNSIVSDTVLDGAYLYTKQLDQEDGVYDGEIKAANRRQTTEITDELNKAWAADEKTRTIELYLLYQIKQEDIPKFVIDNVANLNTNYQSEYSTGVSARKAEAKASITVVGRAMDNIVIDFGQKVQITGLGDNYLKGVYTGENVKYYAKYGTVEIVENSDGNYDVTYIPTSILRGPDTVWLYGLGVNDKDEEVEKVINGFIVYPATTVYYEEGFLFNDKSTGWNLDNDAKATLVQAYEPLGKSNYDGYGTLTSKTSGKVHAYGFDPIYNSSNTGSAGTYAVSSAPGAATSFTFTGTGFELYANSNAGSGYVTVYSKGELNKLYMINTVLKPGTTDATNQQSGDTYYSLPVISETDLPYGTYEVQIKQTRGDAPIYIDGVRIINTIEDSSIFTIDEEDNPDFYELRDYVLKAIGVEDLTQSEYIDPNDRVGKVDAVKNMAGQVYDAVSIDDTAILIEQGTTFTNKQAQDLLDNGPKNELYLYPNQTLVFKVTTNRVMQLGLKAPTGSAQFTLTVNENALPLNSLSTTVDMFYKIADKGDSTVEYTVSIKVTDGVLSVTDLKICDDPSFTFSALTQEDIETALLGANGLLPCNHSGGTATCNTLAQCENCGESYGNFSTEHAYGEDDICDSCGKSAIVITQQPTNGEAKLGERYMVEVKADGQDLKYQWYFRNAGASRWSKSSVKDNTYDDVMTIARAGREVYCVITDANGNSVTTDIAKLIAIPSEALEIVKQPNDSEAKMGEMFNVEVIAKGEGLTYKWYYRNKGSEKFVKSGVTDNTYDDVMTSARAGREVYCVITDAFGNSVTSDTAMIIALPDEPLEILQQPTNGESKMGEKYMVEVIAKGDGLTYQWFFRNKGSEVWSKSGVTDNTYDDVMTKARAGREVYCVITDSCGNSVTTDTVKLILLPDVELEIIQQPADAQAKMGEMFCVEVIAQGDNLTYQWYYRNKGSEEFVKSGVKDNTYDDVMTSARAGREVYCVITDAFGNSVTSKTAMIIALPDVELEIIQQPTNGEAKMGEKYMVEVIAKGDGLTYQWYFRNAGAKSFSKSGVKDNTYDDVMTKTRAGREVYCVITDCWGNSVTTDTVMLIVINEDGQMVTAN